ncbi:MAG: hypothetical protein JWM00_217 [Candidatus Saccharibacteria bacterium]|nr:hypothetical protein [Candidatus Saccharibacteria bacterium]
MPFENHALKLTDFKPDHSFDPARDRLQITLSNGESVIVAYVNRADCIMNKVYYEELYWLDHQRAPGALTELATPVPERSHAGFYVRIGRDDRCLELTLVSQEYIGRIVSIGNVIAITSVRSTIHTDLSYTELTPIAESRRRPARAS